MVTEEDLKIISHLRRDARRPLTEISREIGLPTSTIFTKIKKIEEDYVIKHTSLIDFKQLDYPIRVNFAIKAKDRDKVLAFLNNNRSINSISSVMHDFDFFVESVCRNMTELADFTSSLQDMDLEKLREHHIIEELKREEFLAIP